MNTNTNTAPAASRFELRLSTRGADRLASLVRSVPNLDVEGVYSRRGWVYCTAVVSGDDAAQAATCRILDRAFGL